MTLRWWDRHGVQREASWRAIGFRIRVFSEAADRLVAFGFLLSISRRVSITRLEEALHSDVGLHVVVARHSAGAVARGGGQGGAAMVAVGAPLGSAGGNGQARGGHLYGGVSDQKRGQDHVVSRWSPAGPDRDRTAERASVAGAGSRDGRVCSDW